MSSRIEVDR